MFLKDDVKDLRGGQVSTEAATKKPVAVTPGQQGTPSHLQTTLG